MKYKYNKLSFAVGVIAAAALPIESFAQIEEVIVTAQRREAAIQDVPISITAFSAEDLLARNVENIENINILTPNVFIRGGGTTGGTSGQFYMRGVPGVAIYLDGVSQPASVGALAAMIELERVEVLKGPQGTLFGKNAMGGAISYVSRAPSDTFGARVNFQYGSDNQKRINANIDIPISDNFRTKLTVWNQTKDGYVQSAANVLHGDEDDTVIRLDSILDLSPNWSIRFDVTDTRRNPNYASADILFNVNENQGMVRNYNNNGLVFTDESDAFGLLKQYRNSSTYTGPGWDYDARSWNLTSTSNISDQLTFKAIFGGRDIDNFNYADLDASRYDFFEINTATKASESSIELQLLGDHDRFNWVFGLYTQNSETTSRRYDWQFYEYAPRNTNWVSENNREDTAIFAEASYDVTDRLTVTAGVRRTTEDFDGGQWAATEALPTPVNHTYTFNKGAANSISAASFDSTTPKFSVQYDFTDSVMAYVNWAEGFNGGGVNTTSIPDANGNPLFIAYSGETFTQTEIGLRSQLLDNTLRVNLAYFDGTWDDMQFGEAIVPGRIVTQNVGEAEVSGFEFDVLWVPNSNLSVNLSGGFLDTAYTDIGQAQFLTLGSSFALAPEVQYSLGGQYNFNLSNGDNLVARLDYGWTKEHVTIQDVRLQSIQESYGLLQGRLTYDTNDNWTVYLWGRNLTDEWYQIGGFGAWLGGVDQGVIARPREFGIGMNMEF
jgi:iron complex outermembrane receptor protein